MKKARIYDYFTLVYYPKHPRSFDTGYIPEQILVAERNLKRSLTPDEDVRHINGDPQDNRPENLEIISTSTGYRVQQVGVYNPIYPKRSVSGKTFISCKFQRQCWKEVRAPIARKNKIYLPYVCSWQTEGDIYKCGHFWNYLESSMSEEKGKIEIDK